MLLMVPYRRLGKPPRNQEFNTNYALVSLRLLHSLFDAVKEGLIKTDELRVWAALVELGEQPEGGEPTSLYKIANNRPKCTLSKKKIVKAENLLQSLNLCHDRSIKDGERKPIPRVIIRHIARGMSSKAVLIVCLFYFSRRIHQRTPLRHLYRWERYARFTYAQVQEQTGIYKATTCHAIELLTQKRLIKVISPNQTLINRYGLIFVDGELIRMKELGLPNILLFEAREKAENLNLDNASERTKETNSEKLDKNNNAESAKRITPLYENTNAIKQKTKNLNLINNKIGVTNSPEEENSARERLRQQAKEMKRLYLSTSDPQGGT